MTFVSIIIPCYNMENYIIPCVESALNQSHSKIEIICVDNNSTDRTKNILENLSEKYPGRLILLDETKQGAPAARNKGLLKAKGEWIQFLDADDRLLPDKIKNQVKEIESHPGEFNVIVSPLTRYLADSSIKHIEIASEIWTGLITSRAGSTCSNLYKKDILMQVNGWDETRASSQEAWLLFSLLKAGSRVKLFNVDETIVNERSTGSISKTNRGDNWGRYLMFRKEVWDYLKDQKKLTPQLEEKLKGYVFDSIRMIFREKPEEAKKLFNRIVKPNFSPVPSDATSKMYIFIYKFLGFEATEKLFSLRK